MCQLKVVHVLINRHRIAIAGTSATTRASSRAPPPTPPSNSTSGPSCSSPCPTSGAAMSSTCRFDLYWPLLTSNIDHKLIDLINTILNLCQPKLTATDFCKPKLTLTNLIQGDTSGCAKPSIDFKTKVPFLPGLDRPKRNFCCEVNRWFCTTWCVTLYRAEKKGLYVVVRYFSWALLSFSARPCLAVA